MPTLTLRGAPALVDGRAALLTGTLTAEYTMALGATTDLAAMPAMLAALPGCTYTRDYGKDTSADTDSLTELTAHGTGKLALAPDGSVVHVSWKDDVEQLGPWLAAAPGNLYYYVTWWHEPQDGDVTAAAYRPVG